MPCYALPGGGLLCVLGRQPRKPCVVCRAPANYLCGWPLVTGRTCDAPLCAAHMTEQLVLSLFPGLDGLGLGFEVEAEHD